jgi:hypothetical protein
MLQDCLREAERRGEATIKSRATTYLMVAMRKRGDVDGVREAIPSVIERAREASLPEYEAMAIANRAWVAWRSEEQQTAAADAQAGDQTVRRPWCLSCCQDLDPACHHIRPFDLQYLR